MVSSRKNPMHVRKRSPKIASLYPDKRGPKAVKMILRGELWKTIRINLREKRDKAKISKRAVKANENMKKRGLVKLQSRYPLTIWSRKNIFSPRKGLYEHQDKSLSRTFSRQSGQFRWIYSLPFSLFFPPTILAFSSGVVSFHCQGRFILRDARERTAFDVN
ncbi:hypothetical protein CDAR_599181 [Caerostris darwini]|uniref:Uncharacterized protein n=1 Tax=Caerostris darwini TaxID=1538125 RepID=A0AAV4R3Y6_9ARAC|nr:hypothetical protein CDAR_599181 [Caerostris darwini]